MEKVDCIVVGGGLAGLSAAYGLAREGVEVMVLERGNYAGSKNVTGGRLYTSVLHDVYPELWEEAAADGGPFERPVVRELVTLLGDGAATTVELASDRLAAPSPQSYTVVRARLDQWLADKVTEAGAMVVTDMKADELLLENGPRDRRARRRRRGRRRRDDRRPKAPSDCCPAARGCAMQPRAADYALGYKEVIELPAGTIEDRWHLNPGEGAAQLFMGNVTRGMTGGGFLYTNKESISLGVVVSMEQMRSRGDELESWQLLDEFRELPQIKPLVAGGDGRRVLGPRDPRGRHRLRAEALRRRLPAGRRRRRAVAQRAGHGARHGLRPGQRLPRRPGAAGGARRPATRPRSASPATSAACATRSCCATSRRSRERRS